LIFVRTTKIGILGGVLTTLCNRWIWCSYRCLWWTPWPHS